MIAADSIVVVRMNEDRSAHTLKVSGKQKLFKRNVTSEDASVDDHIMELRAP